MKTKKPNPFSGKAATTVIDLSDKTGLKTAVRYHDTNVVEFTPNSVTLNSGGWRTPTTKRRMNEVSDHYGLNFHVYQEDHEWWVVLNPPQFEMLPMSLAKTMPFSEGMKFPRI